MQNRLSERYRLNCVFYEYYGIHGNTINDGGRSLGPTVLTVRPSPSGGAEASSPCDEWATQRRCPAAAAGGGA